MISPTDFIAFASDWGPSGVIGLMFGWMVSVLWRDRKQSTPAPKGPTAQEVVDRVLQASDAAAEVRALREDVAEMRDAQARMHEGLIKLVVMMEARR